MRQENGKGTVKWILVICAIIAVVFVFAYYISTVIKREKTKELQADLLLVQAKVEIVRGRNDMNKDENPLKGIPLSKISEKLKAKKYIESRGFAADEFANYYVLRDSDLSAMDLNKLVGKNKGSYIVNYANFDVIYTEGYENLNGLWCYKVSEMNKQPERKETIPASNAFVEEKQNAEQTQTSQETQATQTDEEQTQTTEEAKTTTEQTQTTEEAQATTEQPALDEQSKEKINYVTNKVKNIIIIK